MSDWWNKDPEDDTEKREQEYKEEVVTFLESHGYKGYTLGEPKFHEASFFAFCILNPGEDIPDNVLCFSNPLNNSSDINPVKKELTKISFDSNTNCLEITVDDENGKPSFVTVDRMANIVDIKSDPKYKYPEN